MSNIGAPVREITITPERLPIPEPVEVPRRDDPLPEPSQPVIDPERIPG